MYALKYKLPLAGVDYLVSSYIAQKEGRLVEQTD